MIVTVGDATSVSHVYFGDTGADNTGQITYNHTSEYMNFVTNTAERVRIDGSGNVGIGNTAPAAKLQVTDDSLLLDGTTGAIPATGAGTRLMWYPAKAAFRAGVVAGTQWDDANIGTNSTVGGGLSNQAAGADATISGGTTNTASGAQSTVSGGTTNVVTCPPGLCPVL